VREIFQGSALNTERETLRTVREFSMQGEKLFCIVRELELKIFPDKRGCSLINLGFFHKRKAEFSTEVKEGLLSCLCSARLEVGVSRPV
jgi:hypothetical protein